jgi:trans-aconitate methyltransferase
MMDCVVPGRSLRVLDVGCGAGNRIQHLGRCGRVKGVEIDPRLVAIARQRGYDVEHNQDDVSILRETHRVLARGGHLGLVRVVVAQGRDQQRYDDSSE